MQNHLFINATALYLRHQSIMKAKVSDRVE